MNSICRWVTITTLVQNRQYHLSQSKLRLQRNSRRDPKPRQMGMRKREGEIAEKFIYQGHCQVISERVGHFEFRVIVGPSKRSYSALSTQVHLCIHLRFAVYAVFLTTSCVPEGSQKTIGRLMCGFRIARHTHKHTRA
jgi:hypothetical protein